MDDFQSTLPMILHRALADVLPPFREIFQRHDLTDQQWRVLRALLATDRLTVAGLAEATVLPAPSLVGILDRLEKRGFVIRTRSDSDRRLVHAAVTDAGRALYARVEPDILAIHHRLHNAATAQEWAEITRILTKLTAAAQMPLPTAAE